MILTILYFILLLITNPVDNYEYKIYQSSNDSIFFETGKLHYPDSVFYGYDSGYYHILINLGDTSFITSDTIYHENKSNSEEIKIVSRLWPNPCDTWFVVSANTRIGELRFYNILGEMIWKMEDLNAYFIIVNYKFNPGMYFYSIDNRIYGKFTVMRK